MAHSTQFTTPKGTKLPLLDLRGKDYLQVAHRLVWFREDHPTWSIETEPVTLQPDYAIFRAQVKDDAGRVIATGTKHESKLGFFDFIEKAETGAIGRALALCGYGTQFAPELDEGERIVDAPVLPARARAAEPAIEPQAVAANRDAAREFNFRSFSAGPPATARQVQFVTDLAVRKLGARIGDREDIFARLAAKFGADLHAASDLSKSRARMIIDTLQGMPDAALRPQEDDEALLDFDESA